MNELLALGISHKTAPVALRERLAFSEQQALELAASLIARDSEPARPSDAAGSNGSLGRAAAGSSQTSAASTEAIVFSTCNRTEIYQVSADPLRAELHTLGLLAERAGIRPTELADATYSPRNCDAARQLFRVTAGLESMIVGEAEIQGQVRRAFERAQAAGLTGPMSDRLFTAALSTGKLVRSQTAIGSSRVSVPSIAVELASQILGTLESRKVIVLGAGETSELTAQALARRGAGTVFVANRHADRARSIAERFGGHVVKLEHLPEHLESADIVLSSTASPHHILGAEELDLVMARRRHRPLLLIDIAVPRDIDPQCGELEGVTLYDIDDLQELLARNISNRVQEVPQAEAVIENEIRRFARWLGEADTLPAVRDLRRFADDLVKEILAENAGHWESASEADRKRTEAIARAVAKRLLHEPTMHLRGLSGPRRHATVELVRELFGLNGDGAAQRPEDRDGITPDAKTMPDAVQLFEAEGTAVASEMTAAPAAHPLATVHSLRDRRRR